MKKIFAILLLVVAAACTKSEVATTDTVQSNTGVTASSTATTETTSTTIAPGTVATSTTATETVAPKPPTDTITPKRPAKKGVVPASGRPAEKPVETAAPHETVTTSTVTTAAPAPHPEPASAPGPAHDTSAGQAIFKSKCVGCHGSDGKKPANGHILASAEVQNKSDAELTKILHEGAGKISAMAHKRAALTDEQIRDVIAYIRTLK